MTAAIEMSSFIFDPHFLDVDGPSREIRSKDQALFLLPILVMSGPTGAPAIWPGFNFDEIPKIKKPPYGFHDRLPRTLILPAGQPALTLERRYKYFWCKPIGYWVPDTHLAMAKTIQYELANELPHPHGTASGWGAGGCRGPICRRYDRARQTQYLDIRSERNASRLQAAKESAGLVYQPRTRLAGLTGQERLKLKKPVYAAVDPLIVAFLLREYVKKSAWECKTNWPIWAKTAQNPTEIHSFLAKEYPKDVF